MLGVPQHHRQGGAGEHQQEEDFGHLQAGQLIAQAAADPGTRHHIESMGSQGGNRGPDDVVIALAHHGDAPAVGILPSRQQLLIGTGQ